MSNESGHAPGRAFIDQGGHWNLNGADLKGDTGAATFASLHVTGPSALDGNRQITLIVDNSNATGTDPDFFFEGPVGDTVEVDWGDGNAETFTLLGYDPTGNWDNAVEATRTYADGEDTHCIVITGTNLAVLDVLSLEFVQATGTAYPMDFRWLRGSGAYLEVAFATVYSGIAPLISGLSNLRVFGVRNGQLTTPPDLSGLADLEVLNLAHNRLTTPPDLSGLSNLFYIALDSNQLTALPDHIRLRTVPDGRTGFRTLSALFNNLTESAVNAALADCVASEAMAPGAGTVNLGGAAPTGQGITDKATLIAAGWTVNTN